MQQSIKMCEIEQIPGLDGIMAEFYIKFWDEICDVTVRSFNESYDDGQLSESQRSAVISLIFKKGDAQLLTNYRPISLTNCDYKILAFCLANRIQSVIHTIVHPSQAAYVKDRFIGCNIRLVEDVIEYFDKYNQEGVLMMLDFTKAFGSLEWNFLFNVLQKFNFGESFIKWIKTLYDDPITCIKNNGYQSRVISLQRGIRQGCPVSALLFIIATEVMAIDIRSDCILQGINIPGNDQKIKILQYADDGVLFFNNLKEMQRGIKLINKFGKLAGTTLNLSKCEGLWLGRRKNEQLRCSLFGIKWPVDPIRCLGIFIGHDKKRIYELNWSQKIDAFKKVLDNWKCRKLTLFGKITVVKQLALPKILYSATMLSVPENVVKDVNSIIYEFIWGKKDKVKRKVMNNDVTKGGLNMFDVESLFLSVKASWAVRYLKAKPDDIWCAVANFYYTVNNDRELLFKLNCTNKKYFNVLRNIPTFYCDVYTAFNKSKCVTEEFFLKNIFVQPLWGNEFITCNTINGKNSCLFLKHWIDSGILSIGNLRFIDGVLDEQYVYQIVKDQRNILAEVSAIKKALKPYQNIICNHNPITNMFCPLFHNEYVCLNDFKNCKSKFFYMYLVNKIVEEPIQQEVYWKNVIQANDVNFFEVYCNKIKCIQDKKIAEFNFKILHCILPCNYNLVKWKQKESSICLTCGNIETIEHMLFYCQCAKRLWEKLGEILGLAIKLDHIVFGTKISKDMSFVISLIAYLIYKDWLVASMSNKPRSKNISLSMIKPDLYFRFNVYNQLGWDKICKIMDKLLSQI